MEKNSIRLCLKLNDRRYRTQNYIVSVPNTTNMSEPAIVQKIRTYVEEFSEIYEVIYYNRVCGKPIPPKYTEKQLQIVHRIFLTQDKLNTESFIQYMHEMYNVDFVKEKPVEIIVLPVIHE